MKTNLALLATLLVACAGAGAQAVPAVAGPGGPSVNGNLHYDFHYSEMAEFGSAVGNWQTANASASVAYASDNVRRPFSLNYSGGYTWTITGPSYSTGAFQRLGLSQAFLWRKWNLSLSDDVSYRPQAPTTGFSGIPGIGEPIGGGGNPGPSDQSILTVKTHALDNDASAELGININYGTTFNAGVGSNLLRYPDGNGLDTNGMNANSGLTWRLNARNSVSATYQFSHYQYPDYNFTFLNNSALFGFKREWNRKVTTNLSAGPEWISSSSSTAVPSSTRVAVNAAINYQFRFVSAGLSYNRGTTGGSGYLLGAETDAVRANLSKEFGRTLTVGFEGSYQRNGGLVKSGGIGSKYAGAQVTRLFGRHFTAFADYTIMLQSSSSSLPANVLKGRMQMINFGIGYSPREMHLRH